MIAGGRAELSSPDARTIACIPSRIASSARLLAVGGLIPLSRDKRWSRIERADSGAKESPCRTIGTAANPSPDFHPRREPAVPI